MSARLGVPYSTSAMMTCRQLVPLLTVTNIERSVHFYVDELGFQTRETWEPNGKLAWCWLKRDELAVMLQQDCPEEDGPAEGRGRGVILYCNCDDADAIYADLTKRGLQLHPPQVAFYGMKQIYLRDPDGYELCFESRVAPGEARQPDLAVS